MKSQVLLTVWCNISGGAGGEIWHWSLSGVKGLMRFNVIAVQWAKQQFMSQTEKSRLSWLRPCIQLQYHLELGRYLCWTKIIHCCIHQTYTKPFFTASCSFCRCGTKVPCNVVIYLTVCPQFRGAKTKLFHIMCMYCFKPTFWVSLSKMAWTLGSKDSGDVPTHPSLTAKQ